jgi:hypothetical protein
MPSANVFMLNGTGSTYNSFKFGFGKTLPSHQVPKLIKNKEEEEGFITSLYCQILVRNGHNVSAEFSPDDRDKGPDTIINYQDGQVGVQVTRFALGEYLHRKNTAQRRAERIVDDVLKVVNISFPVNVTIIPHVRKNVPSAKYGNDSRIADEIASHLRVVMSELKVAGHTVTPKVRDKKLRTTIALISFQSVPPHNFSHFYGRDNLYINYEFDSVSFSNNDIIHEADKIFQKKNNGKADVLLVWSDEFEILYMGREVAHCLRNVFKETTFKRIMFFTFLNRADYGTSQDFAVYVIKDDSTESLKIINPPTQP